MTLRNTRSFIENFILNNIKYLYKGHTKFSLIKDEQALKNMNLHTNMKENRSHLEINISANPNILVIRVKRAPSNLSTFPVFIIYVQKHTNIRK